MLPSKYPPAKRVNDIEPFHVMALLARARELSEQGQDIIHMEVGEPDFSTPAPVIKAAQAALIEGDTRYTPACGMPELRKAIAQFYKTRYSVDVSYEQIVITPGASGALLLISALLMETGKNLLIADPCYPCNRHFLRLFEGKGKLVETGPDTDYQLNAALIDKNWDEDTLGVMLATPSNPTGSLLPLSELSDISAAVNEKGGHLVVDEIYHGLTYGVDAESVLSVDKNAFVINSFSKYFGMTGWRLGWLVAPKEYIPQLDKLAQNIFLAPATLSQYAALGSFSDENIAILEARRNEFEQRRDYLLGALTSLGFKFPCVPQGAFYLYADASDITDNAFEFCQQLLEEQGVAITPGIDFGHYRANQHIRFAYTTGIPRLKEAVSRIKEFLQNR
jgi:aspartate/methionine/tyrosine aminotransferase